jgi:PKD repeat protein
MILMAGVCTELGANATITYDFDVGTHTVTLTVEDNEGATNSDTVIVTVRSIEKQGD